MEGEIIQNIIKIYQFLFHKQIEVTTTMDLKKYQNSKLCFTCSCANPQVLSGYSW